MSAGAVVQVDLTTDSNLVEELPAEMQDTDEADPGSEAVVVESQSENENSSYELIAPDGDSAPVASDNGRAVVGPLLKTGVWKVQTQRTESPKSDSETSIPESSNVDEEVEPTELIACNLTSMEESNLTPRMELASVSKLEMFTLGGRSIWFYLTLLGVALITLEWWLYHRRIIG